MIKKNAIVLSAGIGNAILMIPLLKKIKSNGLEICIILNSVFINKEFIEFNNFPCDEIIELSKFNKLKFIVNNFKRFDKMFLDYSSSSVRNILLSTLVSNKVIVMRKNHLYLPKVFYINEKKDTHAAVLNLQLFDNEYKESDFDISELELTLKNTDKPDIIRKIESAKKNPVVVQLSSANLKAPYKNWPVNSWILFMNDISLKFPNLHLILMGDENEIVFGKQIKNEVKGNVTNLIGKTDLIEMCSILYHSKFYIGLDSGLMHLAVAYNIPTFSIFGASSYHFVGYDKFDNKKHKVIYNPISCWPCHGFSQTNRLKVKKPSDCQDFSCLKGLEPDKVFLLFLNFYNSAFSI